MQIFIVPFLVWDKNNTIVIREAAKNLFSGTATKALSFSDHRIFFSFILRFRLKIAEIGF